MNIVLPCLNRLKKTSGGTSLTDISFGASPGGIMTDIQFAGLAEELALAILEPELFILIPFMPFGWDFAFDLLGLGPSKIEIQKAQIAAYYAPVFKMLAKGYGYPLRLGKYYKVSWDNVKLLLGKRPDLAALAPTMQDEADQIVTGAFGYDKSGPGIRQRMVNQFLANASLDQWPLQATIDAWKGIVAASTCPPPQKVLPPPPPASPPVPPTRDCPPGYEMSRCFEICGQIRQLSASQQPLGPELTSIMDYFQDCILPPDGSWQYKMPRWQDATEVYPVQGFPWIPSATEVGFLPRSWWPYNWQGPDNTVLVVTSAPDGSPYPQGTLLVQGGQQYGYYVIFPDGSIDCFGNMKPPPDNEPEPPNTPPPPPPPPEPIPAWGVQLRADLDALQADYLQFKQVMQLNADSIKRALWQSMIRSNFQASEVYAKDQAGWQGDNPPAEQPPYPPSWQDLPTPGSPQVLELPPIQEYPQVLEIPVVDIAGLQQQLDDLRAQEEQINAQIEALNAAIQQVRDDCCNPAPPPTDPVDICQDGREKWGLQAECWLDANTPEVPPELLRAPVSLVGQDYVTQVRMALNDNPTGWFADAIKGYAAKVKQSLETGIFPTPTPYVPSQDVSYVFVPIPKGTP